MDEKIKLDKSTRLRAMEAGQSLHQRMLRFVESEGIVQDHVEYILGPEFDYMNEKNYGLMGLVEDEMWLEVGKEFYGINGLMRDTVQPTLETVDHATKVIKELVGELQDPISEDDRETLIARLRSMIADVERL
jgi:hypothetical protein